MRPRVRCNAETMVWRLASSNESELCTGSWASIRGAPAERDAMVAHYLAAQDGPLAAERIVTLLAELLAGTGTLPRPTLVHRIEGRWQAARRRWGKKWKGRKAGAQTAFEFHRHRFPDLRLHAVQARLARIQQALHDTTPLVVEPVADEIFCVRIRDARFEAPGNGRNPDPQ